MTQPLIIMTNYAEVHTAVESMKPVSYTHLDVYKRQIHAAACLVERYADQSIRVDYLVHILVVFAKIIISFIKMA